MKLQIGTRVRVVVPLDIEMNGMLGTITKTDNTPNYWPYQVKLDTPVKIGGLDEDHFWFDENELDTITEKD